MKRKLYFLLVLFACCLLSITQAQTNCDVYISPNSSSNCLLEDYLERYLPLLESGTGEDCVLACKGNVVRYDAVCNAGQQYVWEISGASSYEFTNQNRSVIVTWGMGDIGNISVTVHTSDTTISTSEMCVFLIESPQVGFSSTPTYYINSSGEKIIEICLGESVEFTDMSSAGTTPITGYLWEHDFGVSSSQNYTLTPTQEGEFKVIHCVYNECGCEDCETIILRVLPEVDLELSCYGTVCENTTAIYLVSNPDCSEYRWNVEGGSFEGQGERKIVVHWGSPASGFGTISLDAYPCETECKSLLSLQIPIIINNAKIEGPEVICVGDIVQYELPMWGSTWYQWTVTPQDSNEVVRHEAEYQNQHLLEFTQPGEYVVQTEYGCDFLDCGPHFTQKIIIVKDTMSINSIDSVLCIGDTGDYTTWHGDSVIWRVYRQNGQQIHSSVAPTLSYLFSNPGTYKVTASGVDYCKTAEYAVTILENPPALTTTQGPNVACLNGSILLSGTPTHPNYYLEWEPQCALISPSSVSGDEVTITYSGEVCDVAVYQVHNEYGCRSQAYIHEVDTFVLAPHGLPAVTHTCAGSTVNIEVPNQAPNVLYEWKLFPPNAASIQGDHLQPDIDVLTNHLYNFVSPTIVNMQLTRKYCGQKVIEIVRLSIEDVETPSISYEDTICQKAENLFTATSGTLNNNHYTWRFDDNTTKVGASARKTFNAPGTYTFTLTYRPNSHCTASTVSGQVVVVPELEIPEHSLSGDTIRISHLENLSYVWTFNGEVMSNENDSICVMADTGEYCCIVTSILPPYCSRKICYSNYPADSVVADTCETLELTSRFLSCTEVAIIANNPSNNIYWDLPPYLVCISECQEDSIVVQFNKIGAFYIKAYTEENGQCYRGRELVQINCIPNLAVSYDCAGNMIVRDTSEYELGFHIPDRTIHVEGTNFTTTLSEGVLVDTILTSQLPNGECTITMNFIDTLPCTISITTTYDFEPISIIDIAYSPQMCIGTPFQFTANTTGDIRNYKWDFGDNSYNYGNNIFHTYHTDLDNQFLVQLTVTDRWGCSATDTVYVDVGDVEPNGNLEKLGNDVCMGEARVIEYQQPEMPILSHYYWRPNEIVTLSNWRTVYKTGDYIVLVVTNDYGCKVEDITNVGFLNTPTARITGNATYCFGEKVKLYGNSGNSNTYIWNISGPENHTFTTSNIQFTPATSGNYTVLLTVTSPDNCTATDSTTFVVYAQPTAPKVVVEGCIHEPPVEAISVSGETLLWSNGFRGTEAYYYNDGYLSAYYIDPTTGCPSGKAYAFIEPAPNYDALLTGCYEICSDSLTHQLPVYGFYPYHVSQFQWLWFRDSMLLTQGTDLSPVLPLPNYGTYHLQTEYSDDYGNRCVSESPEFILENTFYCTCDSIQFKPENITCSVEGCKLIYTIRYTICNIGSHDFEFFNLQVPVGGELLSDNLPVDLPAGDCQTLEFSISLTDFTTTMFEFILRDRKQNCEISFVENLNWHTCVDSDCDIADFSFDFNPELSTAHQSSYFQFYAHIENAIEILSMWSRPSQVIDFVYNGSDVEGLLMLDYGLLTQMMANGQEFCLYMVSCVDDAQLCYDSLCIPAEQFFDVIPSEFRQFADNGSLDETLFEPTAEPLSLPAADKPYLAPNPAHNEVTVMGISSEKVVEIAVLTIKGEVVATHTLTHRFEIGRLANATYIVRVRTADNQIHYLKLVKQ